jgi:signal peptidase I
MADTITNTKNKRHIWIAVMLSLILPGLGQVYCGKLIRGLLLGILNTLPISLIVMVLLFKNLLVLVLVAVGLIVFGVIIQLIAIIDSIYLVKHVGPNYELKEYNRWYVYLLLIFMGGGSGTMGSASYIKSNIMEAFIVPVAQNYPTILPGDRVLVNKIVYQKTDPCRGDMVVFLNPEKRGQNYIKRIVAIAGDTIEMKDNQLYVNGQMLQRQPLSQMELEALKINVHDPDYQGDIFYEINGGSRYKIFLSKSQQDEKMQNFPAITIPKYNCFVLGDNRDSSEDSRNFGPVPIATIKGPADWRYWSAKDWLRFHRLNIE